MAAEALVTASCTLARTVWLSTDTESECLQLRGFADLRSWNQAWSRYTVDFSSACVAVH
jgi:hypothetical protein